MSEITLEKQIRFSESAMWRDQNNYYDKKGLEAWDEDVPFYITSNPFIGRLYANNMIRFMQDWLRRYPDAKNYPFYILELGAGTGQFSFYVLKNLMMLKKSLQLNDVRIQYVMSDISDRAFDFWENHPALKSFLSEGVLEFSMYDLYHSTTIDLYRSKTTVTKTEIKNPLIVIANYLFDSIASDVFSVKDGELYESRITTKTNAKNIKDGLPIDWKKVTITYDELLVKKPYYHNIFDDILFQYADHLVETHFQFPISSLQALQNLQQLSNQKLLLLTSDKAYGNLHELDYCEHPEIDFHGSFSVMVNYHAMGEYFKVCGGEYALQSFRENIITGVLTSGFTFTELPEFQLSTHALINEFSPTDYFLLYENFEKNYQKASLAEISAQLNLSGWDPQVFDHVCDHLSKLVDKADTDELSYLTDHLSAIADNFYYLPSATDTLFNLAVFYQNVSNFEKAIEYYQQSLTVFGDSEITFFNLAVCLHSMERKKEALDCLERAAKIDPKEKDVKQWIKTIQKELK